MPEGHLARFIVEVIDQLDCTRPVHYEGCYGGPATDIDSRMYTGSIDPTTNVIQLTSGTALIVGFPDSAVTVTKQFTPVPASGAKSHRPKREGTERSGARKLRAVAPIAAVHQGMPPFLCIHGNKDDQVSYEQSPALCEAMHKVGVGCELITIENGGHGMGGWRAPEMQHWKPEMIAWLKKTLAVK